MLSVQTIQDEIAELKQARRLAHHYQESEIQELADVIGDSLELSRKARDFDGDVIAFCGVWFMAETAKVLNPERIVVVPDADAGCSLVESCPPTRLRASARATRPRHRQLHQHLRRSEGRSDILCTSRNAVQVVNSIPAEKPILFLPDRNLGNYVKRQTGRENMKIWQGACIVHATFPARRLAAARPSIPKRSSPRIPSVPPTCSPWPISSAPPRPSSTGASSIAGARVHRHDRERRPHSLHKLALRTSSSTSCRTRTATAASART
jgi:quinolinate synthase